MSCHNCGSAISTHTRRPPQPASLRCLHHGLHRGLSRRGGPRTGTGARPVRVALVPTLGRARERHGGDERYGRPRRRATVRDAAVAAGRGGATLVGHHQALDAGNCRDLADPIRPQHPYLNETGAYTRPHSLRPVSCFGWSNSARCWRMASLSFVARVSNSLACADWCVLSSTSTKLNTRRVIS